MKPILVAIDFSNTSVHAMEYAIMLSGRMKSDIQLVWVDKVSSVESLYPDTSGDNRKEAKKRFEDLIAQYAKKLPKGVTMDFKLKKGKIYHEIDNLARQIDAEVIITGTHGISGYEDLWLGSNAYRIVTYASNPVINIRPDFPIGKGISRIVAPMDGSIETLQKIPFVVKLATLFKSEVHLLITHNSHLKSIQRLAEKMAQQAITHLRKYPVRIVEDSIVSTDMTRASLDYANSVNADLIAIMTEQETPINIHMGPHAQQLITQSPFPVLSIRPKEKFELL